MPLYFTSTVKTRHLLDTRIHDKLKDAKEDATKRETERKNWVIVRQEDPKERFGLPGENKIVAASDEESRAYAEWCLFPERR